MNGPLLWNSILNSSKKNKKWKNSDLLNKERKWELILTDKLLKKKSLKKEIEKRKKHTLLYKNFKCLDSIRENQRKLKTWKIDFYQKNYPEINNLKTKTLEKDMSSRKKKTSTPEWFNKSNLSFKKKRTKLLREN